MLKAELKEAVYETKEDIYERIINNFADNIEPIVKRAMQISDLKVITILRRQMQVVTTLRTSDIQEIQEVMRNLETTNMFDIKKPVKLLENQKLNI